MTNTNVSIVIPVYNAELTLRKCLDSVCGQTYKDIEILLIDDGSTDKSMAICQEYAAQDPRIVIHSQVNSGPSTARNTGIDIACGEYLSFVDSDDYIEPDMIERLAMKAIEHDADMVICSFYLEDDQGMHQRRFSHRSGLYSEQECRDVAMDVIDNNSRTAIPPYSWIRLIRRSILEAPRLRYNTGVKRSEDYLLWTQVHFRIKSLYVIGDEPLYHYVYNAQSITKTYLPGYWPMCRTIFAELNENLPRTKAVRDRLQAMLIQRSLIALHNAENAEAEQYRKDFDEVLNDRELIKAARAVGLVKNSRRARIYSLMVSLRMKKLIMSVFSSGK